MQAGVCAVTVTLIVAVAVAAPVAVAVAVTVTVAGAFHVHALPAGHHSAVHVLSLLVCLLATAQSDSIPL